MSKHQIELFPNGSYSIRNLELNESMHSSIGPWTEAQLIYLGQSELTERLRSLTEKSDLRPFVIYDVGFGIAANSLAVLENRAAERLEPHLKSQVQISLISFETDLEGIKSALHHSEAFPFLKRNMTTIQSLLQNGEWSGVLDSGVSIRWQLKEGDFRDSLGSCPPADLIFFDLYSPKSSPEFWGIQTFQSLFQKSYTPKNLGDRFTSVITYSTSTSARAALMLAGFYVGKGTATPGKKETTLASTRFELLRNPLDQDWIEHWRRSSQPLPRDLPNSWLQDSEDPIENRLLRSIRGKPAT